MYHFGFLSQAANSGSCSLTSSQNRSNECCWSGKATHLGFTCESSNLGTLTDRTIPTLIHVSIRWTCLWLTASGLYQVDYVTVAHAKILLRRRKTYSVNTLWDLIRYVVWCSLGILAHVHLLERFARNRLRVVLLRSLSLRCEGILCIHVTSCGFERNSCVSGVFLLSRGVDLGWLLTCVLASHQEIG